MVYAWDENFVLPLSHDEVVHGKGSLLREHARGRVAAVRQPACALRLHVGAPRQAAPVHGRRARPGAEWTEAASLDWYVLDDPLHAGVRRSSRDLNRIYRDEPALWQVDFAPEGFEWLVGDARDDNVLAYARYSADRTRALVCLCNFSPVVRASSGACRFRPAGAGGRCSTPTHRSTAARASATAAGSRPRAEPLYGRPFSAGVTLPPLAAVWLAPTVAARRGEPRRRRATLGAPTGSYACRMDERQQHRGGRARPRVQEGPARGRRDRPARRRRARSTASSGRTAPASRRRCSC